VEILLFKSWGGLGLFKGGFLGDAVLARGHRDDSILAILVVQILNPQDHLVLVHAELGLFADR